jgi:peptide deformylase
MTVREIRFYGDPVLRTACAPIGEIDDRARTLVQDLLDTTQVPGRAGVAAPQIGVDLRAFSYFVNGKLGYVINPVLVEVSGEKSLVDEGCLSVPNQWHPTPRFAYAKVIGIDLDGNEIVIDGTGLMAQMLQHECDHLDGKVYIDRLEAEQRKIAMRSIRDEAWFGRV